MNDQTTCMDSTKLPAVSKVALSQHATRIKATCFSFKGNFISRMATQVVSGSSLRVALERNKKIGSVRIMKRTLTSRPRGQMV